MTTVTRILELCKFLSVNGRKSQNRDRDGRSRHVPIFWRNFFETKSIPNISTLMVELSIFHCSVAYRPVFMVYKNYLYCVCDLGWPRVFVYEFHNTS